MTSPAPTPRVSLVIPLYNGAAVIGRALDSVRAQTFGGWEAVVVDDCSTDDGAQAARDYIEATGDARIRLISLEANSGPSAARNAGVAASSGDFVGFLDSDDELLPVALDHLLALAADSEVDVAAGAHVAKLASGRESVRPDRVTGTLTGLEAVESLLQERIWNYNHGKIYRRRLFDAVQHREDIRRYEDIIFNAAAYSYSTKVRFSATPVYAYYVDAASTTWSQKLTADFVTDTETFLREGLNPEVAPLVSQRSWRTMRTTLAVVVLSGALAGGADEQTVAALSSVLRDKVRLRDLPDVFVCAPVIAVSAVAARIAPALYASAYRTYIRRQYELGA
ncbi:glycosyltransferase involved in cell wall biosynthesis [Sinomonas atrocyanea]|uniref:glycosyltransferase family 2 protein n=1 Tax=Sinomonas atrocyanea TaxID=37927 RepID=UPI0027805115|nr:glycosyltransferase family 2 protein [Sinomonas atrocyanea]MDP9885475.1 glycosyltransferase involved in cell wall biosynthesis [Sinomonas atrocyanea]